MRPLDGLQFVVMDKSSAFRRTIAGVDASLDLLANGIPKAEFTVDDDHEAIGDITADGARCAVLFRGAERCRGYIRATPGEGPDGYLTARIVGDLTKLWEWEGWPVPTAAIGSQSAEYWIGTGKTETVVKQALAAAFTRLGVPWTTAASAGRGSTIRAELRFDPLGDKLMPFLDADGLLLTLSYAPSGAVIVDVRVPNTVAGVLSFESGVVDSYSFTRVAPTATRAIVGGRGEGVDREFVQVIDAAREATWGDIIETFVDARNTDESADITVDGVQALAEGAPRVGVTADLVETERFMFGTTFDVGDLIHVRIGPVDSVNQITGVSITDTVEDGVVVVPHIGDADASSDVDVELAAAVGRLARGIRAQGRH